jgi:hypothetical protein
MYKEKQKTVNNNWTLTVLYNVRLFHMFSAYVGIITCLFLTNTWRPHRPKDVVQETLHNMVNVEWYPWLQTSAAMAKRCAFLGFNAASSGERLPTFRNNVSVRSSRVKKFKTSTFSWTSWPLNMGPIRCPETCVKDYHSTLCYITEERRSQSLVVSDGVLFLPVYTVTTTVCWYKCIWNSAVS